MQYTIQSPLDDDVINGLRFPIVTVRTSCIQMTVVESNRGLHSYRRPQFLETVTVTATIGFPLQLFRRQLLLQLPSAFHCSCSGDSYRYSYHQLSFAVVLATVTVTVTTSFPSQLSFRRQLPLQVSPAFRVPVPATITTTLNDL